MTIQNAVGTIRRIYVRPPDPDALLAWRDYAWHAAPDPVKAAEEHAALRQALGARGAEVVVGATTVPVDPDGDPVDGDPGPVTLSAVKAFQKSAGLQVDGLPGPATTAALEKALTPAPAPARPCCWR